MNNHEVTHDKGSFEIYTMGFFLSVALTLGAYFLTEGYIRSGNTAFSGNFLLGTILGLAVLQFLVQIYFFLHLGRETRPHWKLFVLLFMVMVVAILVLGSVWIMHNLNYRMTPQQQDTYIQGQDGGI